MRLHLGLLSQGVDSKLLFLDKGPIQVPEIHSFYSSKSRLIIAKIQHQLWYQRVWKRLFTPNVNEGFHLPYSAHKLENHPLTKWADLINLHWVTDFIDYTRFFTNITKPVVWTLHDMEAFSGGYHYEMDFPLKDYRKTIERNLKVKRYAMSKKRIHFTAPSVWLSNKVKQAPFFSTFPASTIPNGLETDIFRPTDKTEARKALNIPHDRKILLFVAESTSNKRKGMPVLLETLSQKLPANPLLVTIGQPMKADMSGLDILQLGSIHSDSQMALAYSAADLFIIPSMEDNLPNTVIESLSCGTPVIGFRTGGIPEMIKQGINGMLADEKTAASLKIAIEKGLTSDYNVQTIRQDAVSRYDLKVQAKAYSRLFQSILN